MSGIRRMRGVAPAVLLSFAAGCHSPDPSLARRAQADGHRQVLIDATAEIARRHPGGLTLEDAIRIARQRNPGLLARRLAAAVARADRTAAFGAFLPQIQVEWTLRAMGEEPLRRMGASEVAVQDREVRDASLQIVQPLVAPNAWLLYRTASRGARMAELAEERAAQMLDLAVAAAYGQCAAAAADVRLRERELAAVERRCREAAAMAAEGYLGPADLAALEARQAAARFSLDSARRAERAARARWLGLLNLWPMADLRPRPGCLEAESAAVLRAAAPGAGIVELPALALTRRPIEEWLWHALVRRLELVAADVSVELRRNETLRALAAFVPSLLGFATLYTTSDSYVVHPEYWTTGLRAALASLVGLREVAGVARARREAERAAIERDDVAMTVLLQTVEALRLLDETAGALAAARPALEAAEAALREAEARRARDLVPLSEVLEREAEAAAARLRLEAAQRNHGLAVHLFRTALGGGLEHAPQVAEVKP